MDSVARFGQRKPLVSAGELCSVTTPGRVCFCDANCDSDCCTDAVPSGRVVACNIIAHPSIESAPCLLGSLSRTSLFQLLGTLAVQ